MTKMSSQEYDAFDPRTVSPQPVGAAEEHVSRAGPGQRKTVTHTLGRRLAAPLDRDTQNETALLSFIDGKAFRQHFQPDSTILLHGDPVDAIYLIESGTVRCSTIDACGSRQIFSFRRKGAIVGLSDIDRWHFTAEAVDHVILKSVPRAALEQELAVNAGLRQEVRAYMRTMLIEREQQLLTLVSTKGPQRLYRFLKEFTASRADKGYVVLPMSRRDIGDHIGLSTESVSRAFSYLKQRGFIDLKSSDKYRLPATQEDASERIPHPENA